MYKYKNIFRLLCSKQQRRNLSFFKVNITVQIKEASKWQNSAKCIVVFGIGICMTAKINTTHENSHMLLLVYKQAMEIISASVQLCSSNPIQFKKYISSPLSKFQKLYQNDEIRGKFSA